MSSVLGVPHVEVVVREERSNLCHDILDDTVSIRVGHVEADIVDIRVWSKRFHNQLGEG